MWNSFTTLHCKLHHLIPVAKKTIPLQCVFFLHSSRKLIPVIELIPVVQFFTINCATHQLLPIAKIAIPLQRVFFCHSSREVIAVIELINTVQFCHHTL